MQASEEYTESADVQIVDQYERIRDYGRAMRHYAMAGDWDQLVALQTTYIGAVENVADAERDILLSDTDNSRRDTLILEIRAAEAEIRECLERRMLELSEFMTESKQRKQAAQAYEIHGKNA